MINWPAYLKSRVAIQRDGEILHFDCPWCGDARGRGWMKGSAVGCFNAGCQAEPRMDGGMAEWARQLEGFQTRGRTIAWLREEFPGEPSPGRYEEEQRPAEDWCRLPTYAHRFSDSPGILEGDALAFAQKQWGVDGPRLRQFDCRWCAGGGKWAYRILFPVYLHGAMVGWQGRTYRKVEPKYMTSKWGHYTERTAECGRPARAMLFNLDAVREPGMTVVLVEGPGDVLAASTPERPAVALMGIQLTAEKLGLLSGKQPGKVIVALDTEPQAITRASYYVDFLQTWRLPAVLGEWQGGKDAGSGATLAEVPNTFLKKLAFLRGRP